jgi:hypothetical protein
MKRLLRLAGHDLALAGLISARQLMQPRGELNGCALAASGRRSVMGFAFPEDGQEALFHGAFHRFFWFSWERRLRSAAASPPPARSWLMRHKPPLLWQATGERKRGSPDDCRKATPSRMFVERTHDESGDGHAGASARIRTISPLPQPGQHRMDCSVNGRRTEL